MTTATPMPNASLTRLRCAAATRPSGPHRWSRSECQTSGGVGRSTRLKYPVAAMAHHTATTPTTIATLGQIWLIALRIQGSALHLLREIVVDVDDDLRQEHVLERPRPWCRDPILGEQRSRSGRHDDHTVRQEDGLERCASRTGRCCRPRTTPAEAPAAGSLETAHRAHRTARRRAAPPAVPQALGRGPPVGASRRSSWGCACAKRVRCTFRSQVIARSAFFLRNADELQRELDVAEDGHPRKERGFLEQHRTIGPRPRHRTIALIQILRRRAVRARRRGSAASTCRIRMDPSGKQTNSPGATSKPMSSSAWIRSPRVDT